MVRMIGVVIVCILGILPPAAGAQQIEDVDLIADLIENPPVEAERFTEAFLAQVPVERIEQLLAEIRETIGAPILVTAGDGGYTVETETHTMPVEISRDAEGRIGGLVFRPPLQKNASPAEIAAQFETIEAGIAYLVVTDGEVVAEANADQPLAVGSAFKLGVLALLAEAVARGERDWNEVVTLESRHISLPTGVLQTFPVGAPITLHTAAALMISISDNTATDLLIDLVGREALADKLGIDFALTTREFFFLKGDLETRDAFLAASGPDKAQILAGLADRDMPALNPNLPLHDEGIEWYVPARRLCALIAEVAHLDLMAINPGLASRRDWRSIAYKGGSETGVLNMTTQVTAADGTQSCVVMTINAEQAVAPQTPTTIYASLLAALLPPREGN